MTKQLILIRYGELGLKGKNRHLFVGRLAENIRASLKGLKDSQVRVSWGRLWLEIDADQQAAAIERLRRVFGIYSLSPVMETEKELSAIADAAYLALHKALPRGGSFKVETRRTDKNFPMISPEISRSIANTIFARLESERLEGYEADMHKPQVTIDIEIRSEGAFVFGETIPCAGGLPVGCSGKAAVMLSGGIDSPVAAWLAMKRGVAIEAIHFHSFPFTGERAKEKVYDLCRILALWQGRPIRLHLVYFTEIQKAIYANCAEEYGITIMRRFMYRIAERIAKSRHCLALYTGESVGQVASQTLESLAVINAVAQMPVLRPLIAMDKEEIMQKAQQLGSFQTSILPYEDCCTVFLPQYPKIRPLLSAAQKLEEALDIEALIAEALAKTEVKIISN
ncbi:MAG: tRNA 4-thiouridine(8) synthase ThiI [Clostridia bacterium]|nr:tRNA 4-thiouridine(8) synthase ThiI [Clostridia bacterium]